jgi:hypothetical protein
MSTVADTAAPFSSSSCIGTISQGPSALPSGSLMLSLGKFYMSLLGGTAAASMRRAFSLKDEFPLLAFDIETRF